MTTGNSGLFRQRAIDNMSSPDELTDYLRVTSPSVWGVLIAVVVALAGLVAWACVGTLPTKAAAKVVVREGSATISLAGESTLRAGMPVTIDAKGSEYECAVEFATTDEDGKATGHAAVALADGTYDGRVVVDETRAIDFLIQSN